MKKTTKVLLLISMTGFVVGATTNVLWGIGLPIGAIFFGFFLISKVLEKEVAAFDQEQRMRLELAARFSEPVTAPRAAASSESDRRLTSVHARASA